MLKKTIALFILVNSIFSMACTGFVAGKNATKDGYMYIARNEDFGKGANPKRFIIVPEILENKDLNFKNPDTGFTYTIPKHTLRYTLLPDADQSAGVFGEAGTNQYGVSVSTTVSATANDEILKYDGYVKGGLTEPDMASLILMQAKTAREGVELIAKIIDEKGAGEGNVIFVADKNEIWYMEIYTGHQYTAVKVPDDVYAGVGNAFYLGNVDLKSKDVIASKDIITLPQKNKLLKNKNGKFHLALTYREKLNTYNQIRMWVIQNRLNPKDKMKYDENMTFELFRKPDKKIEIKDIMTIFRDRYENTPYNNEKYRPIGIDTNLESHIFQIKNGELTTLWLAMGPVEHSIYIPYYENINAIHESLGKEDSNYSSDSFYWNMKAINVLGKSNREFVGNSIKEYWSKLEDEIILEKSKNDEEIKKLSTEKAAAFATEISVKKSAEIKEKAKEVYKKALTFVATHDAENRPYKKKLDLNK